MARISAERLRVAREARGWTQEDLAAKAGVSVRTIQRLEQTGQGASSSINYVATALNLGLDGLRPDGPPDRAADDAATEAPSNECVLLRRIEHPRKLLE